MGKFFKITFSDGEKTINGTSVKEAIESAKKLYSVKLKESGQEMTKEIADSIEKNVFSIRDGEKNILTQLFENAVNLNKSIQVFNEIADTIAQIQDSDGHIIIPESDLERMRKSFESLKQIPPAWLKYSELFKQINNPQDVTQEVLKK